MFKITLIFTSILTSISAQAQKAQSIQPKFSLQVADSFYLLQDWVNAKMAYAEALKNESGSSLQWNRFGFACYNLGDYDESLSCYNKALKNNPSAQLQPYLYSRIARVYAVKNEASQTFENLEKAINAGYTNFTELDTLKEYLSLRNNEKFRNLRDKAYAVAFPCAADPEARAFDFWVGEWDVYQTGTHFLVGHSLIQVASGGCMILENWTAVGTPHNGKSMNFIDQATGKWEQVWVGSNGGGANIFINGEYRDSAMRFEFEQPDSQGNKSKGRFIFFNQGPNQVRQLNEVSPDGEKTWNTVYDFTYIRKSRNNSLKVGSAGE